eukprot:4864118-Pleurochrysis_carterae.AAC.1
MGTAVSKGTMAACARVKCAEERARMADECPGAAASPARPSESGAEEAAEADFLASSASRRALSAGRRMLVVGPAPSLERTGGTKAGQGGGTRRRDVNVQEGFHVREGVSIDVVGTQDGAQSGVAIEEARKMLPNEELFGRGGRLRPDSCKRQLLVRQAQDVVRRCIQPMTQLPLSSGAEVGRGQRGAGARRRPHHRRH